MKYKAIIDRGFSYVVEDTGERLPPVVARDLMPEVATLLAAAPELLEALENLIAVAEHIGYTSCEEGSFISKAERVTSEARKALSKARGEE